MSGHIRGDVRKKLARQLDYTREPARGLEQRIDEIWRPVAWADGYEVSDYGRVRSWKWSRPHILSPTTNRFGYHYVRLAPAPMQRKAVFVHGLVAEAFLGPRHEGMQVRHLDGNPTNNHVSNLQWGTQGENNRDQVRHGTHPWAKKTHCPSSHPYDEANTYVNQGRRNCRECIRIKSAEYRKTESYRNAVARRAAKKRANGSAA
jgi:hypothetical protein